MAETKFVIFRDGKSYFYPPDGTLQNYCTSKGLDHKKVVGCGSFRYFYSGCGINVITAVHLGITHKGKSTTMEQFQAIINDSCGYKINQGPSFY
jgi:hypothetical protein